MPISAFRRPIDDLEIRHKLNAAQQLRRTLDEAAEFSAQQYQYTHRN